MHIGKIGVVGAGFMGSGIAQVSAQTGFEVALFDVDQKRLDRALKSIEWSVAKLAEKKAVTEPVGDVLARITASPSMSIVRDADLVIEAVYEKIDLKLEVLGQLDRLCDPETILGSNTSTIPITRLSEATRRPDRVIGIHFFGPVPLMKLVEVIPNPKTAEDVTGVVLDFVYALGKNPVLVKLDIPGFLMNRVFGAMACEAIRLVERGAGSIEDIDQGMCDGFNMRVGPLCIADLAGLDVSLNAFNVIHELDREYACRAPDLLAKLVREGKLGAKTGEGFYVWDENGKRKGPAF